MLAIRQIPLRTLDVHAVARVFVVRQIPWQSSYLFLAYNGPAKTNETTRTVFKGQTLECEVLYAAQ